MGTDEGPLGEPAPSVTGHLTRSPYGAFPEGADVDVVRALARDLTLDPGLPHTALGAFERRVRDERRVARARRSIRRVLEEAVDAEDIAPLVEVLCFAGHRRLLARHQLLFPVFDITDERRAARQGPYGATPPERPVVPGRAWSLLGQRIGFPIGVPACALTGDARWIRYFADNGFNVLTYKTIRSRGRQPNPRPNWVFLAENDEPLPLAGDTAPEVLGDPTDWVDPGRRAVSTANSFGVPSAQPEQWKADLEDALGVVHADQLLIVSVMGDSYDGSQDRRGLIEDWVTVSRSAESAGARFIELNLSCPNSLAPTRQLKPPLCLDAALTAQVVETVRDRLDPSTRVIAKLSYLPEVPLAAVVEAIAPEVDAISGVNTLPCRVLDRTGGMTFPGRAVAGASGIAIREHAADFVSRLERLRRGTGSEYEIIGMGGVTDVESFRSLHEAGAVAVQAATGSCTNPLLAWDCVATLGDTLGARPAEDRLESG